MDVGRANAAFDDGKVNVTATERAHLTDLLNR